MVEGNPNIIHIPLEPVGLDRYRPQHDTRISEKADDYVRFGVERIIAVIDAPRLLDERRQRHQRTSDLQAEVERWNQEIAGVCKWLDRYQPLHSDPADHPGESPWRAELEAAASQLMETWG